MCEHCGEEIIESEMLDLGKRNECPNFCEDIIWLEEQGRLMNNN